MIRALFAIAFALAAAGTGAAIAAFDGGRPTLLPRSAPLAGLAGEPAPAIEAIDGGVGPLGSGGVPPDPVEPSADAGPDSRAPVPVAARPEVGRPARPVRRNLAPPRPAPERPPPAEQPAPEPPAAERIDGVTVVESDGDDEPAPPPRSRPSRLGETPIAEGFD